MQQGTFTRTRGTHNRDGFASLHLKVQVFDDLRGLVIRSDPLECLAEVFGFQNNITHNAGPPQVRHAMHASLGKWC